jgi:hypothetical protein
MWIFIFFSDWAVPLSAMTAILLLFATFLAIRENRRTTLADKIREFVNRVLSTIRQLTVENLNEDSLGLIIPESADLTYVAKGINNDTYIKFEKAHLSLVELDININKYLRGEIGPSFMRKSRRDALHALIEVISTTL